MYKAREVQGGDRKLDIKHVGFLTKEGHLRWTGQDGVQDASLQLRKETTSGSGAA